jgi:hypothetical protein
VGSRTGLAGNPPLRRQRFTFSSTASWLQVAISAIVSYSPNDCRIDQPEAGHHYPGSKSFVIPEVNGLSLRAEFALRADFAVGADFALRADFFFAGCSAKKL